MKTYIIDVREPAEYTTSHAENAINIPLTKLMNTNFQLEHIKTGDEIIVYCNSGSRSHIAEQILKQRGYKNVTNGINQAQLERG